MFRTQFFWWMILPWMVACAKPPAANPESSPQAHDGHIVGTGGSSLKEGMEEERLIGELVNLRIQRAVGEMLSAQDVTLASSEETRPFLHSGFPWNELSLAFKRQLDWGSWPTECPPLSENMCGCTVPNQLGKIFFSFHTCQKEMPANDRRRMIRHEVMHALIQTTPLFFGELSPADEEKWATRLTSGFTALGDLVGESNEMRWFTLFQNGSLLRPSFPPGAFTQRIEYSTVGLYGRKLLLWSPFDALKIHSHDLESGEETTIPVECSFDDRYILLSIWRYSVQGVFVNGRLLIESIYHDGFEDASLIFSFDTQTRTAKSRIFQGLFRGYDFLHLSYSTPGARTNLIAAEDSAFTWKMGSNQVFRVNVQTLERERLPPLPYNLPLNTIGLWSKDRLFLFWGNAPYQVDTKIVGIYFDEANPEIWNPIPASELMPNLDTGSRSVVSMAGSLVVYGTELSFRSSAGAIFDPDSGGSGDKWIPIRSGGPGPAKDSGGFVVGATATRVTVYGDSTAIYDRVTREWRTESRKDRGTLMGPHNFGRYFWIWDGIDMLFINRADLRGVVLRF